MLFVTEFVEAVFLYPTGIAVFTRFTNNIPVPMRKAISRNCTLPPANAHECKHLSPLLEGLPKGTTVYADKGYDSEENRQHLEEHQLLDGIMRKAHRKHPLSEAQNQT